MKTLQPSLATSAMEPCSQPCREKDSAPSSRWTDWLKSSLFNTLDICFDDVYREPRRILIVGGCRQVALAQHIALLLPATEITLVDADEAVVQKAKEAICCRFKFVAAPLEALPFEPDHFDLTLAYNFFAYPADWRLSLSELSRITSGNLLLSVHRPLLWKLARQLPGIRPAMAELGISPPQQVPSRFDLLTGLRRYAKIKTCLTPFPWTVFMTEMKPMREEKLVLPAAEAAPAVH